MSFNFNPYNLLAGFIFGTLGWGVTRYGKQLDLWKPRVIGWIMMLYPYLVTNPWALWGIGCGLLVLAWFQRHD